MEVSRVTRRFRGGIVAAVSNRHAEIRKYPVTPENPIVAAVSNRHTEIRIYPANPENPIVAAVSNRHAGIRIYPIDRKSRQSSE